MLLQKITMVIFGLFISSLTCCVIERKYAVEEVEVSKDKRGHIDGEDLVKNKNGEAVLQTVIRADSALSVLRNVNIKLTQEMEHEGYYLDWCYRDLSDTRLGGTGKMPEILSISAIQKVDPKKKFGELWDGQLVVVETRYYKEVAANEEAMQDYLEMNTRRLKRDRMECERKMEVVREKYGLKSKRCAQENDLGDAFSFCKKDVSDAH